MEWHDNGYVISTKKFGESSVVLDAFTRDRGRFQGLVRGGTGRKKRSLLQPGNYLKLSWRARLEEQLGQYQLEPIKLNTGYIISSKLAPLGLSTLCELLKRLPDRQAYPQLYDGFEIVLNHLVADENWLPLLIKWQVGFLQQMGYGLDLSQCAVTGVTTNLKYISPKTGRAVCEDVGLPYKGKLFNIPPFIIGDFDEQISATDLFEGFKITEYFLKKHIYDVQNFPFPEAQKLLTDRVFQLTKTND
ncbi:MAG: DNA repair protein RecO [Rhizobiales bacterium]|nr:DNA repair protein RecO [Hyphomicrobiales bacterium]NRB14788.1 DNA repair protein RecO [Hyphomicrobiales bacterium]